MRKKSFTSEHFPYLPITVLINKHLLTFDALLDTGFEGDIIIPEDSVPKGQTPDSYFHLEVANLGDSGSSAAIICALGAEAIVGRNLARRFHIALEYGRRITVRP
jgi:hypothetical protein